METEILKQKLHSLIEISSEEKLEEMYNFFNEDEYTDSFKAMLDEEFEQYQKNEESVERKEIDKMVNELLHPKKQKMIYKTSFRKRAVKEYLNAIHWYKERSLQAAENFVMNMQNTLNEIENNPDRPPLIYKNYRERKIKKYPFKIIYFIDEKNKYIVVTTLFHSKRNPERKFKQLIVRLFYKSSFVNFFKAKKQQPEI